MSENLQIWFSGAAVVVLTGCFAGPFLVASVRRMRRTGLAFGLIAAGFLVSMATKPPADTNQYAIVYNDGGAESAMPQQIATFNQVTNLAPCTLMHPEGASFAGWSRTDAPGGPRRYDDGILVFNLASPDQSRGHARSRLGLRDAFETNASSL